MRQQTVRPSGSEAKLRHFVGALKQVRGAPGQGSMISCAAACPIEERGDDAIKKLTGAAIRPRPS